ncbi:MAG: MFS transporter [Nocardioides sp.]|nr:MFS transporter [Nocardioides sp.]
MKRPLYGWLTSEAVSLTGTRITMVALPFFVLATTGSVAKLGVVSFVETLPFIVFQVLGGPIIDRIGPRRVAITCDFASVVVIGSVPMLHSAGLLSFPLLLLCAGTAGAIRGPGDSAKLAMVPSLVTEAGVSLERASGLSTTVERTASMLGVAVAGLLVAAMGSANALFLNAATFAISGTILAWSTARLPRPVRARVASESDGDSTRQPALDHVKEYLRQLHEGFSFLRRDRVLFAITAMVALTNLLDAAWATVLVPVWAKGFAGSATAMGLLFAVFTGASALGAISAAVWAERLPRYKTYLLAFLLAGAPRFVAMGLDFPLFAVLAVAAAGGFAAGFINPVISAVTFERIPEELVGRVSSLKVALAYALIPFGGLLGALFITASGLAVALIVCGLLYLAVTMLPALDPRWREIERPSVSDGRKADDESARVATTD